MAEFVDRFRILILAIACFTLTGAITLVGLRYEAPAAVQIVPPAPTLTPSPIRVHVTGAVNYPEVYALPADAIVQEAILVAGGPTDDAALDTLNLARLLNDGEQIVIPRQGEMAVQPQPQTQTTTTDNTSDSGSSAPAFIGPVNINTAGPEELDTLPGIGPVIAQRIIDYRNLNGPFARIEDIQNVAGIGPATFEDLRDLITVN